jgi:cell division protein FtsW (lipid II flippase)
VSTVAAGPGTGSRRVPTGFFLIVLAILVSIIAYAAVGLGVRGQPPSGLTIYAAAIAGTLVVAWLVVRWTAHLADPVLLPTVGMIAGLGLAMMQRVRPTVAGQQAIWVMVGFAVFMAVLLLLKDDRRLADFTYTIGLAGVVLLLLPALPGIGTEINGARLWVRVAGFTFQPQEFGKVLIVIFLASYLAEKQELLASGVGRFGLPRIKELGPLLLAWGASLAILFFERDMGASLLIFSIFVVMVWLASGRPGYLVIGGVLLAVGGWIGYSSFSHVQARVGYWMHALDPDKVTGIGYGQLAQGWFAMASGGLVGSGLGGGSPRLIPYVGSDFIFAAFGEELGMVGAVLVLLLFLILVARGLRAAMEREDTFGKLLATGLTTIIGLQVFIIVAGVTRLIPLTGVPLPLLSYGGSSKVATLAMLGLLVRISAGPWERKARPDG